MKTLYGRLGSRVAYLKNHKFVRNTLTLQAGSFIANIVQALIGVMLARILQPEAYGVYALTFSLAGFLSIFLALGAPDAATTLLSASYARNDKEETREVFAFLLKMTIITGALALVVALFGPWIAEHFYKNATIGWYALVLVAASVISTTFNSFSGIMLQILGRIRAMTLLGMGDQLTRSTLSLGLVTLGLGVLGSVTGHFLGAVVIFFISLFIWRKIQRQHSTIVPSVRSLLRELPKAKIKKYLGFSIWIALDRNFGNLYASLPLLISGIYLTTSEVTYFKLAFGYINLALSLLGPISTLLNVEFPKMQVEGGRRLARNFIKVSLYSLLLSTVLTIGAIIAAPIAFNILYGESFLPSVKYITGLLGYGALMGIGVGLGPVWRAIRKVHMSIMINLITLAIGIPFGVILIRQYGVWGTVASVSIWYTMSHWTSFIYLTKYLKKLDQPSS